MTRQELAIQYFEQGYNCPQSIALSFKDLLNIDEETLLKMIVPFGGGFSRYREVCGTVSAITMIIGYLYGYSTPETGEKKAELYTRTQELLRRFETDKGSIICRELLDLPNKHDDPKPSKRTPDFYKKRPCSAIIGYAASILDEYIQNHPIK